MENKSLKLDSRNRFRVDACNCGKSNKDGKFVPFKGYNEYGYCHSCTKTFLPPVTDVDTSWKIAKPFILPNIKKCILPYSYLLKSLRKSIQNNLISFLRNRFGEDRTSEVTELYNIGCSKQWYGSSVFWYIDISRNVRTGKIMLYNKLNGKRVTEPYNHITWVHSKLKIANDKIKKCLYGEHIANMYPDKPIGIVESEKTAIIASLYFPNLVWMATGGISNLTYERLIALSGRNLILFPDMGAYNLWCEKANSLKGKFNIEVDTFLEINATPEERKLKIDIADYLLKFNLEKFLQTFQ